MAVGHNLEGRFAEQELGVAIRRQCGSEMINRGGTSANQNNGDPGRTLQRRRERVACSAGRGRCKVAAARERYEQETTLRRRRKRWQHHDGDRRGRRRGSNDHGGKRRRCTEGNAPEEQQQ